MNVFDKKAPDYEQRMAVARACTKADGTKTAEQIAGEISLPGVDAGRVKLIWREVLKAIRRLPDEERAKHRGKFRKLKRSLSGRTKSKLTARFREFKASAMGAEVVRLVDMATRSQWADERVQEKLNAIADSHQASHETKRFAKAFLRHFLKKPQ